MIGKIYMDKMGRFPVKYSWEDIYTIVRYNYDSNYILTWAMKNKQKKQWQKNIRNCMEL